MWQTFTFLDPAGNLLARERDFGAAAWTNGALIALTPGISDPLGTTRATRVINAGIGGGVGGADAGGAGEFSVLPERVGTDAGGIERHADDFDDRWERGEDFRAGDAVGADFSGGESGTEHGQR